MKRQSKILHDLFLSPPLATQSRESQASHFSSLLPSFLSLMTPILYLLGHFSPFIHQFLFRNPILGTNSNNYNISQNLRHEIHSGLNIDFPNTIKYLQPGTSGTPIVLIRINNDLELLQIFKEASKSKEYSVICHTILMLNVFTVF